MKYQKYFYALCLLISLGACGEANPQNNSNRNNVSGDYALTQSSSEECRAIFNPHIRVQQTGSQLNIQTLDSSAPLSAGSNTESATPSSETSSPAVTLGETAGQIESIQGSIDAQGNLQLSGQLRVNGSSYAFQCSGNLAGDIASLSCQITGSPEAACRLRYERSSSSSAPLTSAPVSSTSASTPPSPAPSSPPLAPATPAARCEPEYARVSSSSAECNRMLGDRIFLEVEGSVGIRSTGEVPQTLAISQNASGELHLARPQGRFYSEDCVITFSEDLNRIEFSCSGWERSMDPPSCSVSYEARSDLSCLRE